MLNEQFMVSQVFPDMYPHGDAGPQLFADAELDELTKDLAAARAARAAAKDAGEEKLAAELDKKILIIAKMILRKMEKYS